MPNKSKGLKESVHQQYVFNWAKGMMHKYPELDLMFHIPNGGLRDIKTAKKLKAEGVKAGVPDIFLPVSKQGYHGLFIELKSEVGVLSKEQKEMLKELNAQGYYACVCKGYLPAIELIEQYLEGGTK